MLYSANCDGTYMKQILETWWKNSKYNIYMRKCFPPNCEYNEKQKDFLVNKFVDKGWELVKEVGTTRPKSK